MSSTTRFITATLSNDLQMQFWEEDFWDHDQNPDELSFWEAMPAQSIHDHGLFSPTEHHEPFYLSTERHLTPFQQLYLDGVIDFSKDANWSDEDSWETWKWRSSHKEPDQESEFENEEEKELEKYEESTTLTRRKRRGNNTDEGSTAPRERMRKSRHRKWRGMF